MKRIYNICANLFYKTIVLRNTIYSIFFFKAKKINPYNIPIIINNRNRLTFLKSLVEYLLENNYKNIYIIDNDSSYPPLIEYYKTLSEDINIIYSEKNLGYLALKQLPIYNKIKKNFYVYTDSDVLPVKDCPPNFMNYFLELLIKYPYLQKVGFSLKLNDLPDSFNKKEEVIKWENKLYECALCSDVFLAPIDTTFALHRPLASISTLGRFKHARTMYPYEARHMPWYNDSEKLSEEELYYIDHVEIGTQWSKGIEVQDQSFFKRVFKKYRL